MAKEDVMKKQILVLAITAVASASPDPGTAIFKTVQIDCTDSGGTWIPGRKPECKCPKGMELDENGGECVLKETAPPRRLHPKPQQLKITGADTLVTSDHIKLDPQTARARPNEDIKVHVTSDLESFGSFTLIPQGNENCFLREVTDDLVTTMLTLRSADTFFFVTTDVAGSCKVTIVARAGAKYAQADALYEFGGDAVSAKKLEVSPSAPKAEDACRVVCEGFGADAKWNAEKSLCEPADATKFAASGRCTVAKKPEEAPKLSPDVFVTCDKQCEYEGGVWDSKAKPEVRCKPAPKDAEHLAGPCRLIQKPVKAEPAKTVIVHEGGLTTDQVVTLAGVEASIVVLNGNEPLACRNSGGHWSGKHCTCFGNRRMVRDGFLCEEIPPPEYTNVSLGLEGRYAGFFGSGYKASGFGAGVLLPVELRGPWELVGHVGYFSVGEGGATKGEPAGVYGAVDFLWTPNSRFAMGLGPNFYALGFNRYGEAEAVVVGGHVVVEARWKHCRIGLGLSVGELVPDKVLVLGPIVNGGCSF